MFRITKKLSEFKFDDQRYLREMDRRLNKLVKEAAREWLLTVLHSIANAPHTVGDTFPIQTGEAKGSLLPLATVLNQSQIYVSVPIAPAIDSRYKDGRLRPNRSQEGRSKGSVRLGRGGQKLTYVFEFETDVLHFEINNYFGQERFPSTWPNGWQVWDWAADAFEDYIDKHIETAVPSLVDYIYLTEIS